MQFIVSAIPEYEAEDYNNIFTIHESYLKRIRVKYDDDLYPTLNTTLKFLLPYELVEKCLNYVLDLYLRSRNYIFAIELLQINSNFQTKFYKKYFNTMSNRYGITSRLYSLFHLLYDLWNNLQDYNDCTCLEIRTSKYKYCNNFFVWNYDEEDVDPVEYEHIPPVLLQNNFTPQRVVSTIFHIGPLSTDRVLLANYTFRNGIYYTDYYRTPIIYLRFIDILDADILPTIDMLSTKEWISLGKLIRLGFGSQTGVYVEVKNEENFGLPHPGYVVEI